MNTMNDQPETNTMNTKNGGYNGNGVNGNRNYNVRDMLDNVWADVLNTMNTLKWGFTMNIIKWLHKNESGQTAFETFVVMMLLVIVAIIVTSILMGFIGADGASDLLPNALGL